MFIYYRYIKDDEEIVYLMKGTEPKRIKANKLSMSDDPAFSFSIWLYLTKFEQSTSNLIIFRRGQNKSEEIQISDFQNNNDFQFMMEMPNNKFGETTSAPSIDVKVRLQNNPSSEDYHTCHIPSIAIQKWVNVTVAVRSDVMDVFYNGKLLKHCVFKSAPLVKANTDVYVAPNANIPGQLSKLTYYKKYITPQKAWEIYTEGPGNASLLGNLINRYGLKIVFMKDNLETDYRITM